ncbi:glycoside hydrolase family 57 protein [Hydrogenimonas sp.]
MVRLALYWHMHQPDYRDATGVIRMPWVFLHAIKDYYEMPWLLSLHPPLKATFNLTASLIGQLGLYEEKGAACDRFLTLWQKDPADLGGEERDWVVKICRSSRFATMVKPLPRYAELFGQSDLNDSELVELEVLFLLSWCGNYLRRNDPTVASLLAKGSGYDASDKASLLDALLRFLPTILPLYRSMREQGRIALTTTPLNHPILPLLIDMETARRSNPKTAIPSNHLSLAGDAQIHIERALSLFKKRFGTPPGGFWPAEGAVDEKSAALYERYGIGWIATDEEILFRSTGDRNRRQIYRPYRFGGLKILFRDHPLSDRIGFTYRFREAASAAEDFLTHLRSIEEGGPNPLVPVILDGENAWEFYPDNAFGFFTELYEGLKRASWCETVTMDEAARGEAEPLSRLHPGSWIDGTFDTWVGHPQKNAAWELLYQTRSDYLHHEGELSEGDREAIVDHFLACESSDWFWWYGEDHHTEYAADFDRLFREHMIAIYRRMKVAPPGDLFRPILPDEDLRALVTEPKFPIHPVIDGRVSSFFEWLGSGMIDERVAYSTMEGARGPVTRLYWGEDDRHIYLRLDGEMERLEEDGVVRIYTDIADDPIELSMTKLPRRGEVRAALDSILEIAIAKRRFDGARTLLLRLEVEVGGVSVQTLPSVFELRIDLNKDYSEQWFV